MTDDNLLTLVSHIEATTYKRRSYRGRDDCIPETRNEGRGRGSGEGAQTTRQGKEELARPAREPHLHSSRTIRPSRYHQQTRKDKVRPSCPHRVRNNAPGVTVTDYNKTSGPAVCDDEERGRGGRRSTADSSRFLPSSSRGRGQDILTPPPPPPSSPPTRGKETTRAECPCRSQPFRSSEYTRTGLSRAAGTDPRVCACVGGCTYRGCVLGICARVRDELVVGYAGKAPRRIQGRIR